MIPFPPALDAIDNSLFVQLNGHAHAPALDLLVRGLTVVSNQSALLALTCIALSIVLKGRQRRDALLVLLVVLLCDLLVDKLLKPAFHRPRPIDALLPVRALTELRHSLGFPSAHAANSACVFGVLVGRGARGAWIAAGVALLIGYSRVYVGVHRPLDVLAGWSIGAILGYMAGRASMRLEPAGPPTVQHRKEPHDEGS